MKALLNGRGNGDSREMWGLFVDFSGFASIKKENKLVWLSHERKIVLFTDVFTGGGDTLNEKEN